MSSLRDLYEQMVMETTVKKCQSFSDSVGYVYGTRKIFWTLYVIAWTISLFLNIAPPISFSLKYILGIIVFTLFLTIPLQMIAALFHFLFMRDNSFVKRLAEFRESDPKCISEIIIWQENSVMSSKREAEEKVDIAFKHATQQVESLTQTAEYLQRRVRECDESIRAIYQQRLACAEALLSQAVDQSNHLLNKQGQIETETRDVLNLIADLKVVYADEIANSVLAQANDVKSVIESETAMAEKAIAEMFRRTSAARAALVEIRDDSVAKAQTSLCVGFDPELGLELGSK